MNNKPTILIIEDEKGISGFISATLSANGYRPIQAATAAEAEVLSNSQCPDLILLDLGLPDQDGLFFLKRLREWTQIPVVIVSARDREREKVEALDLGADDYITKPFGTAELLARIRAALRRGAGAIGAQTTGGKFSTGDLVIDYDRRMVSVRGKDVHLTQVEYKIVTLISRYAGKVLTYDSIIKQIWGPHAPKDNQILRVNMANIRRKLEDNPAEPRYILTELGVGYRMPDEDS